MSSIYLVMSNDAPITTFRSIVAAREFIARQPTRTANGHTLHWTVTKLELSDK